MDGQQEDLNERTRKEFEQWANNFFERLERYETLPTKPYKGNEQCAAWKAWQAARKLYTWTYHVNDDFWDM